MVTIEQKLTLFYKLIAQSMDIELKEKLKNIEDIYSVKVEQSKKEVDKEAELIEERAKKKCEARKTESISKSKVIIKRDIMILKEKYFNEFMIELKQMLKEFVDSENYQKYLLQIVSKLSDELKEYENCNLVVILNNKDKDKYIDILNNCFSKYENIKSTNFKTNNNIIGGLILEVENTKIDLSIDSVLEENKTYIMQSVFESIGAGE